MPPPNGMNPKIVFTIQPEDVRFDPPAPIVYPNVYGYPPGKIVNLYSFDHDLGQWVSIGTGSVTEDGAFIASDPGVGIIHGGWHFPASPPEPTTQVIIDRDMNNNGRMEDWRLVVDTARDPDVAYTLNENDGLGSNHGGPNTERPDHRGIDIQLNNGDPVYAVADGVVVAVAESPGAGGIPKENGVYIRILHTDGSTSQYLHLQNTLVGVGDTVDAGVPIATGDSTGQSTGPHLHLTIRDATGALVNPVDFFN